MLQYNPDKRLPVQNLAQHDFITKNASNFTKIDLNQISDKINIKGLNNNIKQNDSIIVLLIIKKVIIQINMTKKDIHSMLIFIIQIMLKKRKKIKFKKRPLK